jgi:hypothetical protein
MDVAPDHVACLERAHVARELALVHLVAGLAREPVAETVEANRRLQLGLSRGFGV